MVNLQDIRERAKALLENGEARAVLGFTEGTAGNMATPKIITQPEEADGLVWDPTCVHNLALYLVEERKREMGGHGPATSEVTDEDGKPKPIAIVAKGCDSRAVNVLLQENYFKRDDVHVLGVSCEATGMIDQYKLAKKLDGKQAVKTAFNGGDKFKITTNDGDVQVPVADVMADRCLECRHPHPVISDDVFGEEAERNFQAPFTEVDKIDSSSLDKRWAYWKHQFDRCIRCFACRSVCPMCYCDECVVDSITFAVSPETSAEEKANRIKWIERSNTTSDNMGYHLVRAMHLAGRCVDCGECERVCPMNIPVRMLNNVLEREANDTFGYDVGMEPDQPSFVSSFRDDDPNDFIR